MGDTPSESNPDLAAQTAQLSSAAAPDLLSRIADRGLVRLSNRGAAAEILGCEYRIAILIAGAEVPSTWTEKCVRPPFPSVWVEYQYLEMMCGAHITEMESDVFRIRFVTCSKRGRAKPRSWPGPEIAELGANGLLERRQPAISDGRNSISAYPRETRETLEGVFNSVYPRLALINEIHTNSGARDCHPREVLPVEPHELGAVVLMWGDGGEPGVGSPLVAPRRAPAGHSVRSHDRRLASGRVTKVKSYDTGDRRSADPVKPRVYIARARSN